MVASQPEPRVSPIVVVVERGGAVNGQRTPVAPEAELSARKALPVLEELIAKVMGEVKANGEMLDELTFKVSALHNTVEEVAAKLVEREVNKEGVSVK